MKAVSSPHLPSGCVLPSPAPEYKLESVNKIDHPEKITASAFRNEVNLRKLPH